MFTFWGLVRSGDSYVMTPIVTIYPEMSVLYKYAGYKKISEEI